MAFCRNCGAQLADGTAFCSGCGTAQNASSATTPTGAAAAPAQGGQPAAAPASAPMASNVAGLLCYILGFITGIIFLVIEPYKNDKFVRFHAFQSIFFSVAMIIVSWILGAILFSMFSIGMWGMISMVYLLFRLAIFALWIFLMYKAYNNEQFKLPFIGDLAAKQAAA